MKIYLIRHGRQCSKLCNVNVDLSQEGFRQAALVGERLVKKNIDKVYSSDYLRAVQTAQAANLYWNVEHEIDPGLREISFGDMEGLSDKVIAERFADFKKEQAKMEQDLPYPGGESAGDAVKRAFPVLERIASGRSQPWLSDPQSCCPYFRNQSGKAWNFRKRYGKQQYYGADL